MLFPLTGPTAVFMEGMITVSISMFLLISGMEVDLSNVVRQGKTAFHISATGIVIPFIVGFGVAFAFPSFLGMGETGSHLVFCLFLAIALSISALPVIAKTLMDLNLYRTDLGMIVMPAAIIQDVIGWCVFAVILSMIGVNPRFSVWETIGLTVIFAVVMLTVVRKMLDRVLPWIQAHWSWPGGIVGVGVAFCLICAAFTEWVGIHALFGAFFFGVALGDSRHMSEKTRFAFDSFISSFFAPLFFASIGLKVNFIAHFDFPLVLVITVVATVGKVIGSLAGGYFARLSHRDSLAVGFAMNARGAMEIILGIVALDVGLITPKTFVALVVMALVTSLMSGPLIKRVLKLKGAESFIRYLKIKKPLRLAETVDRDEAIRSLVAQIAAASKGSVDVAKATQAVLDREATMHTGIGHGLAIPHARIDGIQKPMIAIGVSESGIDFDAPDGIPSSVIVLLLAPSSYTTLLLQLYADIAKTFAHETVLKRIVEARNPTEFIAALKMSRRERQ